MSPLRSHDGDERTPTERDCASRSHLFDELAEQIEILAMRAATWSQRSRTDVPE